VTGYYPPQGAPAAALQKLAAAEGRLTGAQRAAALLLVLGEEKAATLLERLYDDEVRDISAAMTNVGTISAASVEKLCADFANELGSAGALVGGWDATERMLQRSLPKDRVAQIMQDLRGPAGRTLWDKIANVNEAVLANYLTNEHPQTVALVLSKITPEHAARVLGQLANDFAGEVILRMLRMESPQPQALERVEQTLQLEFMSNLARATKRDTHEVMAEIFNNLDRSTEARLMGTLESASSDSAARVRALMFTFEDLRSLDIRSMQVLVRTVDRDKLPLALKSASGRLLELFFKSMSDRASRILMDDIESLGPVLLRDVESAQLHIVNKAKELAQQGEIRLGQGKDEAVLL
jgi:flagellar motor switch protein FliG